MSGLSADASKIYDGTTNAVVTGTAALDTKEDAGSGNTGDGKAYNGDTVGITGTATGTYNSKDVGTGTIVTFAGLSLTGAQAGNYSLTTQSAATGKAITAKSLSMSGLSADASKIYDGTTNAVVTGTAALDTKEDAGTGNTGDGKAYNGDTVSITGTATGTYNSKDVGTGTIVTFAGLSLTGTQAGNYSLTTQSAATGKAITAKSLSMSGLSADASKIYDGTTNAIGTGTAALDTK